MSIVINEGVNGAETTPTAEAILDAVENPVVIKEGIEARILALGDGHVIKLNKLPTSPNVLSHFGLKGRADQGLVVANQKEVNRIASRYPDVYRSFYARNERIESLNLLNEVNVEALLTDTSFLPESNGEVFVYFDKLRHTRYVGRVMKRIEGKTLGEYVSEGIYLTTGGLSQDDFNSIGSQLAKAYDSLNNQGYIHGHNSSGNKMVDNDGSVYLIDMGGACKIETNKDFLVGSEPSDFAPERFYGKPHKNTDQYGLASELFKLVVAKSPIEFVLSESKIQNKNAIREVILKGYSQEYLAGKLGSYSHLAPVFFKAFSVNPEERFNSCTEFFEELMRNLKLVSTQEQRVEFHIEQ